MSDERQHIEKLLEIHRRNLKDLEEQQAKYGLDVPPVILNRIRGEDEAIAELERKLRIASMPEPLQDFVVQLPEHLVEPASEAFNKSLAEINRKLLEVTKLQKCLDEWKEVHNALHDLHKDFSPVAATVSLSRRQSLTELIPQDYLRDIKSQWETCKRALSTMQGIHSGIKYMEEDEAHTIGEWVTNMSASEESIDEAIRYHDKKALEELSSRFTRDIIRYLYLADKALRDTIKRLEAAFTDIMRRLPQ